MSGRVTDSDYVKPGEILPVNYIVLGEANAPILNSATIQSQYLERRRMRSLASEHPSVMMPVANKSRDRSASPPSRDGKERVGMSKSFSAYLENLPAKEKEKREKQDVPFPGHQGEKSSLKINAGRKVAHNYAAKSRDSLRKDILSVSLFPNLYNHKSLLAGM